MLILIYCVKMRIILWQSSSIQVIHAYTKNSAKFNLIISPTAHSTRDFLLLQSAVERSTLHSEGKWNFALTLMLEQLPANNLNIKFDGPLIEIIHYWTGGNFKLILTAKFINRYGVKFETPPEGVKTVINNEDKVSATYSAPIDIQGGWDTLVGMTGFVSIQLVADSDWFCGFGTPSILLQKLYREQLFSDFCIVAENGAELPCHKAVLAGHSDVLEAMIRSRMTESSNSKMELKRTGRGIEGIPISEDGARAFLEFLYCNKSQGAVTSSLIALELLTLGHQYAIPSMESVTKDIIMMKSVERIDIDVALQLFSHFHAQEGCEELKNRVIKVLQLKMNQLQTSKLYKELYPSETSRQLFEFTLQKTLLLPTQ